MLLEGGVAAVDAAAVSMLVASVGAFRLAALFLIAGHSLCLQSGFLRQVMLFLHGTNLVASVVEFFIGTRRGLRQRKK